MSKKIALIAGASGIVGQNLASLLVEQGDWDVLGLARRAVQLPGVTAVSADLQDPVSLQSALAEYKPTHVFLTTWLRQPTEAENIRVNGGMVRNLLDELSGKGSVEHVALVTGLKHYLGPFESYGKGTLPATPFREEQGRLPVENFYYAQEDEVFAAARSRWVWLERPSPAHHHRLRAGQCDEHGRDAGCVRITLQGNGDGVCVSGLKRAVAWRDRHDGCTFAGKAAAVGFHHCGCEE